MLGTRSSRRTPIGAGGASRARRGSAQATSKQATARAARRLGSDVGPGPPRESPGSCSPKQLGDLFLEK